MPVLRRRKGRFCAASRAAIAALGCVVAQQPCSARSAFAAAPAAPPASPALVGLPASSAGGKQFRAATRGGPLRLDSRDRRSSGIPASYSSTDSLQAGEGDRLSRLPKSFWRLVILGLCVVWATNFAVIKNITAQPGVTTALYTVSRFTIAGLVMLPAVFRISSWRVFLRAVECGSWVTFGYIGQAIGLMTTTAAKSCFICALNVVFVTAVVGITKRKVRLQAVAAAAIAICGVAFLELAGSQHFVIGDLFSLAQPIGFGMGYIRLEQIMEESPGDAWAVTGTKLLMVMLGSWLFYALSRGGLPNFASVISAPAALTGILWCGLVTTALALVVESVAFRYVDATSASVIFTTEPLWAALVAFWLIREPFSVNDGIGGALVVLANLVNELPSSAPPWRSEAAEGSEAAGVEGAAAGELGVREGSHEGSHQGEPRPADA